jgi:hypothetical protein
LKKEHPQGIFNEHFQRGLQITLPDRIKRINKIGETTESSLLQPRSPAFFSWRKGSFYSYYIFSDGAILFISKDFVNVNIEIDFRKGSSILDETAKTVLKRKIKEFK